MEALWKSRHETLLRAHHLMKEADKLHPVWHSISTPFSTSEAYYCPYLSCTWSLILHPQWSVQLLPIRAPEPHPAQLAPHVLCRARKSDFLGAIEKVNAEALVELGKWLRNTLEGNSEYVKLVVFRFHSGHCNHGHYKYVLKFKTAFWAGEEVGVKNWNARTQSILTLSTSNLGVWLAPRNLAGSFLTIP